MNPITLTKTEAAAIVAALRAMLASRTPASLTYEGIEALIYKIAEAAGIDAGAW